MTPHRLYYYPYASFTNQQLPLLKVAAVWFDELVILDPIGASLHSIGLDPSVSQAETAAPGGDSPDRRPGHRSAGL